tara:strand:- start:3842 stop:4426 length:585 start_codon:yes stop_codon:yes gene_type:complete
MYAIPFHHLVVGLVTGTSTLACISSIVAWLSTYFSNGDRVRIYFDNAAYVSAIAAIPLMPIAVISGTLSMGNPGGDAMSYNKFLFTGLTTGFLLSLIVGRWRFGPNVWLDKRLGVLQGLCAIGALICVTILGSIGGKMSLGKSTMDLIPFWPQFNQSIVLNQWFSLFMFLLGIFAITITFRLGPEINQLSSSDD